MKSPRAGMSPGAGALHSAGPPSATQVLVLLVLLATAAVLRLQVIRAIPHFFGPTDPALYFQMGRGCVHHGVPRIDFVHHFLTWPASISHIEDYYEPLFGYLLAVPMAIAGETPAAAASLSLVFGLVSVALVWTFARRFGNGVALTAAALVALEPWSVYYSGLIMKETTVTAVVLLFLEALRRLLAGTTSPPRTGAFLGGLTVAAGLIQYELLPILALTTAIVLGLHRRSALWAYAGTLAAGAALLLLVTSWLVGVPFSAKVAYFLGRSPGDPEPLKRSFSLGETMARLLPAGYVMVQAVTRWYPAILVLAALGATRPVVGRAERTVLGAFTGSYLYIHGVPLDLWCRDFITLTYALAPTAALALHDRAGWQARSWAPALALGLLFFLFGVPMLVRPGARAFPALAHVPQWGLILIGLGVASVVFAALLSVRGFLSLKRAGWLGPAGLVLATGLGYWVSLPYFAIYRNASFPDYEIVRARRERACEWMKGAVARAPVMASHPEEVELYSGFPAVVMPDDPTRIRPGQIERVCARYGVRYLLVEPGTLPDSLVRTLAADSLGESERFRLFRMRGGAVTGEPGTP